MLSGQKEITGTIRIGSERRNFMIFASNDDNTELEALIVDAIQKAGAELVRDLKAKDDC